ncbi:hypothetical protein JTE90_013290 [Oedothorax gibbosus]|uniref:Uncharacterized protein n=1 Tax=Oedothorax gibbosus TaxID=931172 RepID=A0AAV6VDC6_9ARAC|nr:hypothetical protein JTE90_013290 [Oedothorax gibbosus]
MWACRPQPDHDDMPIDLRKPVVLEREERRNVVAPPTGKQKGVGENGKSLETAIRRLHHNRQLKDVDSEPSKDKRCRSTDNILENIEKDLSLDGKRSSSCPDLTVAAAIKPKPSPIKPKSSFIQRSSAYLSENFPEPSNLSVTSTTSHQEDNDELSDCQPKCGAKKRKSFIPVYGDRGRPITPEEDYHHDKRRPLSLVKNNEYYSPKPRSPFDQDEYYRHHEKRPRSPEYYSHYEKRSRSPEYYSHLEKRSQSPVYYSHHEKRSHSPEYYSPHEKRPRSPEYNSRLEKRSRSPEYYSHHEKRPRSPEYYSHQQKLLLGPPSPVEPEEYFSHPEVLLRRQLQQHNPSPYLVHVYDYYQQLVQRMREHSSPGMRMPPPVSPPSGDEDSQLDGQRKRPCRALTGKHVRQGTGASISTLLTLRQKIQERQKAKDTEPRSGNIGTRNGSPKKIKVNPKIKSKSLQVQKC